MQCVYRSAVVGSGGQQTEPVKAVNELAYRLSVASQVFRKFHIGSCDFSHLQSHFYTLDIADRPCPHGMGHQPVQASLPLDGKPALQNKIPLLIRKDGAVVYRLFLVVHGL